MAYRLIACSSFPTDACWDSVLNRRKIGDTIPAKSLDSKSLAEEVQCRKFPELAYSFMLQLRCLLEKACLPRGGVLEAAFSPVRKPRMAHRLMACSSFRTLSHPLWNVGRWSSLDVCWDLVLKERKIRAPDAHDTVPATSLDSKSLAEEAQLRQFPERVYSFMLQL